MNAPLELTLDEVVRLGAVDTEFYCRTFHASTFRQPSPPFAKRMWDALENPHYRNVELLSFRGSAKTTRLRTFAAKRIAYGISRTILYIGASERDAIRSVQWIRNQVERNQLWSSTFGLSQGKKWEETQIEIQHKTLDHPIWVLAAGISGSLRGINFDDYRPDLIIVDDPITDETAATSEQREKTVDLILGAVQNSLAPPSEEPNAKLALAATPQHNDDASMRALRSLDWHSVVVPCWTEETLFKPVEEQESVWPERWPSQELRKKKLAHIRENKLSVWAREMECRLVTPEESAFRISWLNFYDHKLEGASCVLAIDPVPPPSERELQKGLAGKDFECQVVWGRSEGNYYLLDYEIKRGHDPSWSIAKMFELARRHRVTKIVIESVAYQRTLAWLAAQEMQRRGIYYTIIPYTDSRKKATRIISTIGSLATHGKLFVRAEHSEFIQQYETYSERRSIDHDDVLDASAIALSEISNPYLERGGAPEFDDDVDEFPLLMRAP
jgi:predicted phage terminase large subunit-like protein